MREGKGSRGRRGFSTPRYALSRGHQYCDEDCESGGRWNRMIRSIIGIGSTIPSHSIVHLIFFRICVTQWKSLTNPFLPLDSSLQVVFIPSLSSIGPSFDLLSLNRPHLPSPSLLPFIHHSHRSQPVHTGRRPTVTRSLIHPLSTRNHAKTAGRARERREVCRMSIPSGGRTMKDEEEEEVKGIGRGLRPAVHSMP